jgi:hypothetical protein
MFLVYTQSQYPFSVKRAYEADILLYLSITLQYIYLLNPIRIIVESYIALPNPIPCNVRVLMCPCKTNHMHLSIS